MHLFEMPFRQCDAQGCGHFGAGRGDHTHKGVDMACTPGTEVKSPVRGQVTKLGWPYADKPDIRYVEVTADGYQYRMFYVDPGCAVGDYVEQGEVIGTSQRLESMDRGGTQHVHFEIKDGDGEYVDPTPVIIALRGMLRVPPE